MNKNYPLTPEQQQLVEQLLKSLTPEQCLWLSGYLAGVASGQETRQEEAASQITVLYGTETGHSEEVAEKLGHRLLEAGFRARVVDMADYHPKGLKQERFLLVVVSTHGEGEPPAPAEGFFEFLHSIKAPRLTGMRFAVCALGDSSYQFFCQAGKDIDRRLEELGAERIVERVDCDVDYEAPAERWISSVVDRLKELIGATSEVEAAPKAPSTPSVYYDRHHPFEALVFENINLNGRGSDKRTHHIEFSLEGSELLYEPGDAVGIFPQNAPEWAEELLERLGFDPLLPVETKRGEVPLREALISDFEITTLTPPFVQKYAEVEAISELQELCREERRHELLERIHGLWIVDLIERYPPRRLTPEGFLSLLRPMQPRLYSIASSQAFVPDELHICVAYVKYEKGGRIRKGVASSFLADRVKVGDRVPIYIEPNKHFRIPQDPETPIIMVGPGTGVAPFRAFLQHREATGARGKNWLFFGERRFRTDFLYQIEFQRWLKSGLLTRLDVAFSRDQPEKIYVQHRMWERSRELFAWLEEGASFYVCGDASRMAPDVHEALIGIVAKEGQMDREQAVEYVKRLQKEKRYLRDVY